MANPLFATFAAIGSAIAGATAATATALTAIGVGAGAASSIAGAIFSYNTLFSLVALAASSLLTPDVNREGSPTDWRPDTNAGIPVVLGRAATAGKIIHMDEHGPDNRYLTIVNLLSAGPIQSIESFKADRVAVTFSGTGATSPSDYADKMWFSTSTGASATALTVGTLPHGAASLAGWDANSTLPGLAHTLWTLYQDSKFKSYPQGAPTPLHILRGVKVYDPRKDSTYPGGSGSHRLDNPSTWEFSKNPGLHALAWCLGHTVTDPNTSQVFRIGIGVSASGVDWPAFVELANVCDTNNWEVSAVPTSTDDKHQVLKAILQAGGARYASLSGKISCIARTPRTSTVTVTAADTAGPFEIDVNADRLTRRNTITPRCVQEDHDWQMTPQDAVTVAEYVTADGGELPQTLDYPYVAIDPASANKDQPEQLAAYAMLDSREPIAGAVAFRPHLAQVAPGDVFTVDEPGFLLDGVELLCLKRTVDVVNNVVRLTFVSESAGKHDFALGLTNTPPTPPGLSAPDIRDVPAPAAPIFSATAGTGQQPSIVITATNADAAQRAYVVEYRPTTDVNGEPITYADDQTGWEVYGQFDITTENVVITGLEPNTGYQIAIRYVSQFGVIGDRRVLGTITTGSLVANDAIGPREDIDDTRQAINDRLEAVHATLADAAEEAAALSATGAHYSLLNWLEDPLFRTGTAGYVASKGHINPIAGSPRGLEALWGFAASGVQTDRFLTWPGRKPVRRYDGVQASVDVRVVGALISVSLQAVWSDGAGDVLSTSELASGSTGRIGGVAFAPEGAASVEIRLVPTSDAAAIGAVQLHQPKASYALPGQTTADGFEDPQNETVARIERVERTLAGVAQSLKSMQVETRTGRAQYRSNVIAIADETSARVSAFESLSTDFTALEGNVYTKAQADALFFTESDVDGSIAAYDLTLQAQFENATTGFYTRAQADALFYAEADVNGAIAGFDLSSNATFAAQTASVTLQGAAISDIEGNLAARFAIAVDGGGNGSFISLEDGTTTPSKITLGADLIELDGDVIVNGTLTASALATGQDGEIVASGTVANFYSQTADPAPVSDGSLWFKSSTSELFIRISSAWSKIADISLDSGFSVALSTTSVSGSGTTGSIAANPSGGATPYRWFWECVNDSGIITNAYPTSPTSQTTTVSSASAETGQVRCTVSDANGVSRTVVGFYTVT